MLLHESGSSRLMGMTVWRDTSIFCGHLKVERSAAALGGFFSGSFCEQDFKYQ
jgi:hypothetical protein